MTLKIAWGEEDNDSFIGPILTWASWLSTSKDLFSESVTTDDNIYQLFDWFLLPDWSVEVFLQEAFFKING